MGLGGQLLAWDPALCGVLADAGFYVIRYDNRDVGCSTWLDDAGVPDLAEFMAGTGTPPYTVSDMAADAAGLLEFLGLPSAHIVGASMGGMIAQTFAIEYPERTRTLVSNVYNRRPERRATSPRGICCLVRAATSQSSRRDRAGCYIVAGYRVTRLPLRRGGSATTDRCCLRSCVPPVRHGAPTRSGHVAARPHPGAGECPGRRAGDTR